MAQTTESVQLTLAFTREGTRWVGLCVELGTSTYDRSLEKCEVALRTLVAEHLNLLEEAGEREAFFEQWGIETTAVKPTNIVLRAEAEDWSQAESAALGPFYQPGIFPLGSQAHRRRASKERLAAAV